MTPKLKRLQTARDFMIRAVATRSDGQALVPVVLRLEQEIAAESSLLTEYERILAIVARKSGR